MERGTILKTKIQFKKTKIDLNFDLCTGTDKIKKHCNEQRRLVQLAYENKIRIKYNHWKINDQNWQFWNGM